MRTGTKLASTLFMLMLLFGFASGAQAQAQDKDKSWEIDRYGDDVELTYRDDGYDDVTIRDHGDGYGYRGDYGYGRPEVSIRYDNGYRNGGGYYGGYDRRDYPAYRYERPRYRNHRHYYRGW